MEASPTILLVEDDANDLCLVLRSIEKSRLVNPVQVARDGEEAIQYLAGTGLFADRRRYPRPFLLLLDLHMPLVDGFEVLQWVRGRSEYRDLKIAVLTASADERDYRRAMDLGANSYFVKPGSLEEFVNLMLRIQGHWMLLDGQLIAEQEPSVALRPPALEKP